MKFISAFTNFPSDLLLLPYLYLKTALCEICDERE